MAGDVKLRVQRSIFDLDTFETVTLVKEFEHQEASSVQDALQRVGGSNEKLLSIINEGLRAEARRQEGSRAEGWRIFDDNGEPNGPFAGTPADDKVVNALVLQLAKAIFGYSKDGSAEEKRAAKEQAINMIKSTPTIKDGLKKSAALSTNESELSA